MEANLHAQSHPCCQGLTCIVLFQNIPDVTLAFQPHHQQGPAGNRAALSSAQHVLIRSSTAH